MTVYSNELRKFFAPEVLYGCGARYSCPSYIKNLGGKRVFLVSDRGLERSGWAQEVESILKDSGVNYTTFYDITPNPRDFEVAKGVEQYHSNECDMIVAVGGGSSMDCAKGIGILASNSGAIHEYEGADKVKVPMPPLICIPTTAGSSADVSQFSIVTNTEDKYKMAIVSKSIVPDVSLIDPELSLTMSEQLTAETGLDALTHAFEAYVSNAASPMTDLHALQAVRHISKNLIKTVNEPDNIELRSAMMLGSMHAGFAFSNASLGLVHSMAHALGGLLDLPHGLCNSLLLEHVVKFNFKTVPERYRDLAELLTEDKLEDVPDAEVAERLTLKLKELRESLSIAERLPSGTVTVTELESLVEKALNDVCVVTNPREASSEDVMDIYEKIV